MKPSSNVCGATTKVPSTRVLKKQINIRWNSKIFFQVGLIVSLLATFFVMELEIGTPSNVATVPRDVLWEDLQNVEYTILEDAPEVPKEQPVKEIPREIVKVTTPVVAQNFVPIDDNSSIIEGKVVAGDAPVVVTPVATKGVTKTIPITTSVLGVEHVPVFPGCEGLDGNSAKIECLSSKIRAFIEKRFETGKFDYFEPGSVQSISTFFTIDAQGAIVEIKTRAADKNLEAEAKRVISKLPVMQPGRQGDTPVNVTYGLPIHFKISK